MNTPNAHPLRGEVWLVNLDPAVGAEIKKARPAVVLSSDAIGLLPVKLIAPFTDWKPYFSRNSWLVKILPTGQNGLSKPSAVDTLQLRGLDHSRFLRKFGLLSDSEMEAVVLAVASTIEFFQEV